MNIQRFRYEEEGSRIESLTTVELEGEPWFVVGDVCRLLELQNPTKAVSTLDDDEKLTYTLVRSGQRRLVNLVSESGLYALVFKSRKPSAKEFRKWVTKEVIPAIRKTGGYGINRLEMPNFVVRYNDSWHRIDRGYFSVIGELFIRLYGRFEQVGHTIPSRAFNGKEIRPDVSVGRLFAEYLRENFPGLVNHYKGYRHVFPNGVEVEARQYKNEILPLFIRFIDEIWMPRYAESYFAERDKKALPYLPKLLAA